MKREYFKVFFIMLGCALLLAALAFFLTEKFREARNTEIANEARIIDEIGDIYGLFNAKAEEFATKHDEYIKNIDNSTSFYYNIPDNYNRLIEDTKAYEKFLVELDDLDDYLYDHCIRKFYSNGDTNKNCLSYQRNMEKIVNTFIEDLIYFNNRIKAYNEWTDTENESVIAQRHYDKYEEYKSEKYTKYVDIDGDGNLLGANLD